VFVYQGVYQQHKQKKAPEIEPGKYQWVFLIEKKYFFKIFQYPPYV